MNPTSSQTPSNHLKGRWWIYPTGHYEFCDHTNLVDPSAEDLARDHIESLICQAAGMDYDGQAIADTPPSGGNDSRFEAYLLEGWDLDPKTADFMAELTRRCPEAVDLYRAYKEEPREYVMRELGWALASGLTGEDVIETRKFDGGTRKRIADAVDSILVSDERGHSVGVHTKTGEFVFRVIGVPERPDFTMTLSQIYAIGPSAVAGVGNEPAADYLPAAEQGGPETGGPAIR